MSDSVATDSGRAAAATRDACIEAALAAYEDAGIQGLCIEGRWEAAIDAIRSLDVDAVARGAVGQPRSGSGKVGTWTVGRPSAGQSED